MADRQITPAILDAVINGVPVFIYKRPGDGVHYASLDDYARHFGSSFAPVEVFRVPARPDLEVDFLKWPEVVAKLKEYGSCERCGGTRWLEPIGPKSDGSYITSRPCPRCN